VYRIRSDGSLIENITRDTVSDGLVGIEQPEAFTYIDRVELVSSTDMPLNPGERRAFSVRAFDRRGRLVPDLQFRWRSLDSTVVAVDSAGQVHARQLGQGSIIVSAGGWRSDTVKLLVEPIQTRALLLESFDAPGVDRRWTFFGEPRPYLGAGLGENQTVGFVNNGDDYLESGAVTRTRFPTARGLTVEFSTRGLESWRLHNQLTLEMVDLDFDSLMVRTGGIYRTGRDYTVAAFGLIGGLNGDVPQIRFGRLRLSSWPAVANEWHRIAVQLRPDGHLELYFNGRFLADSRSVQDPSGRTIRVILGNRSRGATLVHDNVVVYQGLKYSH
jgi:hypothetical protein